MSSAQDSNLYHKGEKPAQFPVQVSLQSSQTQPNILPSSHQSNNLSEHKDGQVLKHPKSVTIHNKTQTSAPKIF